MTTFDPRLTTAFDELLSSRERELCALLGARDAAILAGAGDLGEVTDFKDAAAGESMTMVDAAQAEQAALELEQVLSARRRLHDHGYGVCLDCGAAIALERLQAMPAAAYCITCQSVRELREAPARPYH